MAPEIISESNQFLVGWNALQIIPNDAISIWLECSSNQQIRSITRSYFLVGSILLYFQSTSLPFGIPPVPCCFLSLLLTHFHRDDHLSPQLYFRDLSLFSRSKAHSILSELSGINANLNLFLHVLRKTMGGVLVLAEVTASLLKATLSIIFMHLSQTLSFSVSLVHSLIFRHVPKT